MSKQRSIDVTDTVKRFSGTDSIVRAAVEYCCSDEYNTFERYEISASRKDTIDIVYSSLNITFRDGTSMRIDCSEWASISFSSAEENALWDL